MKKIGIFIVVFIFGTSVFAQSSQIDVTVLGLSVEKGGQVKIGVYQEDGFPTVGKEIIGKDVKVDESSITVSFDNISDGVYAIAVFQDKDSNGKLNSNLFGAPTELYGFSNNKYGKFGPPDFETVSFKVESGKAVSLTINLE